MKITIFIVFLLTDLLIVGIYAVVYGGKYNYQEGRILGVHVPKAAAENTDVSKLINHFRKVDRIFYIMNLPAGIGASFLYLGYTSVFLFVWSAWLLEFCILSIALMFLAHRRMYDLKSAKKWIIGEPAETSMIDTSISSVSDKLPFSHWWHLPVILLNAMVFFFPQSGTNEAAVRQILFTLLPVEVIFWGLHIWYSRRENIVYSSDSKINLAVNRMAKRIWSGMWITANYLLLLSAAALFIPLTVQRRVNSVDWILFSVLLIISPLLITASALWLERKRNKLLSGDKAPVLVDDDLYWKNGWYNNPNDKRLFVPNWINSTNYSMNMAKPAAKIITGVFVAGIFTSLLCISVLFARMDFIKPDLIITGTNVEVKTGMYNISFPRTDILDVELLDSLPDEKLLRTNGAATDQYLPGHFRGEKTGKCMLYLYGKYRPLLAIRLPEYTVFINSSEPEKAREWYGSLRNRQR